MSLRSLLLLGGLLVVATMSRPLGAQHPRVVVEAGLTAAHFPEDDATAAGPALRLSIAGVSGHFFGTAAGGALGTIGAGSGFGEIEGGVRSSSHGGWSGELGGTVASVLGSGSSGGARMALLDGRGIWSSHNVGGWLRASGHVSERARSSLPGVGLDAGAWWSLARAHMTATLAQQWARAELFADRFHAGFAGTTPVRYTEGTLALHTESDAASFDVAASARRDRGAGRLFESSLNASAAYWPRESMAVVFSVTHQLPDFVRGADAVDAVSIGLRFGQAAPMAARDARFIPVVQVSDSSSGHVLRVRAAGARQVDVMGDFTDWEARPLSQIGAVFERPMPMSSGTHRMLVRIDGGAWRPAANTPAVDDDLGGRVGLLVVP